MTTTSAEYVSGTWQGDNSKVKQEPSSVLTKGKCLISV